MRSARLLGLGFSLLVVALSGCDVFVSADGRVERARAEVAHGDYPGCGHRAQERARERTRTRAGASAAGAGVAVARRRALPRRRSCAARASPAPNRPRSPSSPPIRSWRWDTAPSCWRRSIRSRSRSASRCCLSTAARRCFGPPPRPRRRLGDTRPAAGGDGDQIGHQLRLQVGDLADPGLGQHQQVRPDSTDRSAAPASTRPSSPPGRVSSTSSGNACGGPQSEQSGSSTTPSSYMCPSYRHPPTTTDTDTPMCRRSRATVHKGASATDGTQPQCDLDLLPDAG